MQFVVCGSLYPSQTDALTAKINKQKKIMNRLMLGQAAAILQTTLKMHFLN